jgi:hypothetical protein
MIEELRRQKLLREEQQRSQEARARTLHASLPDDSWEHAENLPGANEAPRSITQRGVWISDI